MPAADTKAENLTDDERKTLLAALDALNAAGAKLAKAELAMTRANHDAQAAKLVADRIKVDADELALARARVELDFNLFTNELRGKYAATSFRASGAIVRGEEPAK